MDESIEFRISKEKLVRMLKVTHQMGQMGLSWEEIEKLMEPIASSVG